MHEFEILNGGSAELLVQRITASCGCTATTISSKSIAPGKAARLRMEFNTAGFFGDKTKTVEVLTNDPENPELIFTLKGVVVSGVSIEPARLEFGELNSSVEPNIRRKQFSVSVREGSAAKISSVKSFSRYISVSSLSESPGRGSYQVEVLPEAPLGDLRDRVIVEFEDDQIQPVNIPITASIKGDLRLTPSVLSFGILEPGPPVERRVQVENRSERPVSFEVVPSFEKGVYASLVDVQPGKQAVLIVRVDPTQVQGDLKTSVELRTSHPIESKIVLGVFGVQSPIVPAIR